MNYRVFIYRNNKVAVLPVNGADSSQQACQCAEENLRDFPGKFDFKPCGRKEPDRIEAEQIG